MHTSDVATPGNSATERDRQAKLRAAAELMRGWVKTQRTSDNGSVAAVRERIAPTVAVSPPPVHVPRAPVAEPPPIAELPPVVVLSPAAETAIDTLPPVEPAAVREVRRRTGPLIPPELVTWIGRAAAAAAVAAVLVGVSWTARRSWPALKPTPNVGTAVLESDPPGATVLIDGESAGTTPLTKELPAGSHRVEFRRRNVTRLIPVEIVKGKTTSTKIEWNVRRVGRLTVQSTPEGAQILINGKAAGTAPATIEDLPVGTYTITLKAETGTTQRTVTIAEGATAELSESIFSGWLHVSSPIPLQITDGRRVIRLDDRNQALVQPGERKFRFENKAFGFVDTHVVDVKPGETTSVVITPPQSTITVTATYPSEVLVDGERAGDTPLENFPVDLGTRDITVSSLIGGVRRKTVTVTVDPVRMEVDFARQEQP